jgi:hypothetical protein
VTNRKRRKKDRNVSITELRAESGEWNILIWNKNAVDAA